MTVRVFCASAYVPELSGLRSLLGDGLAGRTGAVDVIARTLGIGVVAAAATTTAALRDVAIDAVVFVGTCGAYAGRGLSVGDVVVGRRVRLVSTAMSEGRAAIPAPMRANHETGELSDALARFGARKVDIATTLAITTDDLLAARVAEGSGCDVEHLEAFAVAHASAAAGVPCAIVLGVANLVGSGARGEWQRNHHTAGEAAGACILRWLESGAPEVARATASERK